MTTLVTHVSDDGPDDDETPRLKINAGDDYWVQVSPGKDWKFAEGVRFFTSGTRDYLVTNIIAGLYSYLAGNKGQAAGLFASVAESLKEKGATPYRGAAPAPEEARITVELQAVGPEKRSAAHDLLLRAHVTSGRKRSVVAVLAAGTMLVVRQAMVEALAAAADDDQLWASLVRVRGLR